MRLCYVVDALQDLVPVDSTVASKKVQTLGMKFVEDVDQLVAALNAVEQHYVRCVKSNMENKPWKFHARTCYTQLKYVQAPSAAV